MLDRFLGDVFGVFVEPVLDYSSAVWCSAADTHLIVLDRVVSGARYLIGSVFECDIAYRRSVTVLCVLYEITCNDEPSLWCSTSAYVPVSLL